MMLFTLDGYVLPQQAEKEGAGCQNLKTDANYA
jgi:hypothetical protein